MDERLAAEDRLELLRMRSEMAALDVKFRLLKLMRALAKAYNPDQLRVPAGNPDGGQWTDEFGVGASGDSARIRIAQLDGPKQYAVDLNEEEAAGGHAVRDHVGKTDSELLEELRKDWVRWRTPNLEVTRYRPAEGSFFSKEDANNFVNPVLEQNKESVDAVANRRKDDATLEERFGYPTGKEAYRREPDSSPYIRPTYGVRVIIQGDSTRDRGYRVRTAFPINERVSD